MATESPRGVLRDLGLRREALLREMVVLDDADAYALRTIGVDLAAVRRRAEAVLGPGALDRPTFRRKGLFHRPVRVGGPIRFTAAAKRALEQSLGQAINLKHGYIGTEHVLLGLLAGEQDPASQVLRRLGIDPAAVRARTHDEFQRRGPERPANGAADRSHRNCPPRSRNRVLASQRRSAMTVLERA